MSRALIRSRPVRKQELGTFLHRLTVMATHLVDERRRRRFEALAAEVYEPLQRYLYRRAPRQDVGELLDDVLLTLWRRLDDVPAEGALPWTYGVARNALANHRRAARRRARLLDRLRSEPAPSGGDEGVDDDVAAALQVALERLPPADREMLRLWAWEQLEPRDIATVLGISPNAAAIRLSRAKRKLHSQMGRKDPGSTGHEVDETAGGRR